MVVVTMEEVVTDIMKMVVVLKDVSSFRESKSDERKFYIFTATKTLHLRTDSISDRAAWLQALASAKCIFPLRSLNGDFSFTSPKDLSISTERLKKRLQEAGMNENLVKDCEQIMLSEFSEMHGQIKLLHEERTNLFDALRQLEEANLEAGAPGIHSSLGRGKYSAEKEKAVSLWSMIKDNVGKDLTRVCLPVYFNEPISSLQKCFEDLEYSYLLDRAYEHGKSNLAYGRRRVRDLAF
ncbi:hypothetical protein F2Q70_00034852 [Brassica cretica]|uniref:PH domain-containing protein n=1 Tax=Brassica cretica TaxID=69181 RepID=A0A8S9JV87_BRACR|nr:hypothetical protein F2Q70_00034852 [Brassica cretica]